MQLDRELRLIHRESQGSSESAMPAVSTTAVAGVRMGVALEGGGGAQNLVACFDVYGHKPRSNSALSLDRSQWGLWEWDVVELFVRANSRSPTYYEFQLSPLGQFFELEIFEPRKRFNQSFESGFRHEVTPPDIEGRWRATFRIPLARLGWDGRPESIQGNGFAILGEPASKTYWSLHLPMQLKPDYHLPQYFRPLV